MHIDKPNDSTDKPLKLRSNCTKILALQVNIPKSIAFIYTSIKKLESETLKDVICSNNKNN